MASNCLLQFITNAQNNIVATFHNFKDTPAIKALFTIEDLFQDISTINHSYTKELLLPMFASRCHGCFFGAVRLVTSGQVVETYRLLRGCIEDSLYAHIFKQTQLQAATECLFGLNEEKTNNL